ncbi:MAG TPA: O-antigen ligase family protein [Pyrinomonadaceae bacterium]|nr:O-antigen ligase family protein [Pyrinomonadaceae bacterium]
MPNTRHVSDYQPVAPVRARAGRARGYDGEGATGDQPPRGDSRLDSEGGGDFGGYGGDTPTAPPHHDPASPAAPGPDPVTTDHDSVAPDVIENANAETTASRSRLKRGHGIAFAGLFAFTFVLYFRPYELFSSLSSLTSLAFYCAAFTVAVFVPAQFALEGNLTARPREVNLVLLLALCALLSMPLAGNRADAWNEFNGTFSKALLMFVVTVNVVRTERRLVWMLLLAVAVSCMLGWNAVADYRSGRLLVAGSRIEGAVGGMFGNPNDMALHLVTILPVAVALCLRTRNPLAKIAYVVAAGLMLAGVVVSFSRGGFLGLVGMTAVLAWKLGRRHRLAVFAALIIGTLAFVALAPGDYGGRLSTIVNTSRDLTGSASSRWELLLISLKVSAANPLFGIGMGNFHHVGLHNQVSHNAYTQVSAEMGLAALAFYVLFMVAPLKSLRRVERETLESRRASRFYHLAVGLQAALVGYMICSFFASVAYQFYVYYLVGYAVCLRRLYEANAAAATAHALADDARIEAARDGVRPATAESYAG